MENAVRMHADAAAAVTAINISSNNLQPRHMSALEEQLTKFPALKHLNLSNNLGLRLLPVGILRIAVGLESFNCDRCSLLLPPQSDLTSPHKNPRRIQNMLEGRHSWIDQELKITSIVFTRAVATATASLLQLFPGLVLKHLDLSVNTWVSGGAASTILELLAGSQTSAISFLSLSGTGLVGGDAVALEEQLKKFPALKHLDLSHNLGLRLLPLGILRIAVGLESFNCDGCSLLLPPQSDLTSPDKNPRRIQSMLEGRHFFIDQELKITGLVFTSAVATATASLLQLFRDLKHLDLSANTALNSAALAIILRALAGAQGFAELNISGSDIDSLPDDIASLLTLEILHLNGCKNLSFLPVSLGALQSLRLVHISHCTSLLYPPKSIREDPAKTATFLRNVHKNSDVWRRLKVVFLGNGRSGKTSMLRMLAKKPLQHDQQSTRGVTVNAFANDLKPGWGTKWRHGLDLELSFWDFAGQLEYSAAHEYFMSTRQAVYVAVYSVLDDNESIMQQLLYWLSVIPEPASSPHLRLIIAGTKIDLLPSSELRTLLHTKRRVIRQVVDAKGLAHLVQEKDILFVSSSKTFNASELNMTWASCRRYMKDLIYEHCGSIFENEDPQQLQLLKFPKQYKQMSDLVAKLWRRLSTIQKLPCCRLDHEDAVNILGSILREKDKDQRKNYFKTELVITALRVLTDLGIIVLYGHGSPMQATATSSPVPSICLEPQFLPGIMSLLVDPRFFLPPVTTVGALKELLEMNPDVSRVFADSPNELKDQLVDLLESVGLVRRYGDSQQLLVPLALRGRPVCWSQFIRGRSSNVLIGQRLGVNPTAAVPAALFMKLMLEKCVSCEADRMWGCAFVYDAVGHETGGETCCMFVRLKEDRRSVDVVALFDKSSCSVKFVQQEIDSITEFLGKDFSGANQRMHLCPMCCSSDAFVRSGAAHAFHMREVDAGGVLQCSRFHDMTAPDVLRGKFIKLDLDALSIVYPNPAREVQLPWKRVGQGGIISSTAVAHSSLQSEPAHDSLTMQAPAPPLPALPSLSDVESKGHAEALPAEEARAAAQVDVGAESKVSSEAKAARGAAAAAHDSAFHDGAFTDVSFFVLTGQVAAGDVITAEHLPEFMRHMSMCASQDCSCEIALSSGERKTLHFSFKVGQSIPNLFFEGLPIHCIYPSDIGDRAQQAHAPQLQRFCVHDSVLVLFGPLASQPKPKFLVFPGSSDNLQLCRITPAFCQTDATAACCWSELQVCIACPRWPSLC